MKINDQNYIYIDTKIQDGFREKLAKINEDGLNISCVKLGDSDFDYRFSNNPNGIRTLNAPFRINDVKYPLIFSGANSGLNGYITVFARKIINEEEYVAAQSLYQFPQLDAFEKGLTPPSIGNGKNFASLIFDSARQGYVIFLQTILYNYVDPITQRLKRFNEKIDVKVYFNDSEIIPDDWDVVIDDDVRTIFENDQPHEIYNNSFFLSKNITNQLTNNNNGRIELIGEVTNIKKTIYFNI